MNTYKITRYLSMIILIGFGLLTLFLSSSVIFDLFGIRGKEGNYVLFVVWANFISSFLYLISAYGFVKFKRWTKVFLATASIILFVAFVLLKIHIGTGGIYETKTVSAMIFRFSFTVILAIIAYLTIDKQIESVNG